LRALGIREALCQAEVSNGDYTTKVVSRNQNGEGQEAEKDLPTFATEFCNSAEASTGAAASRFEHPILH
jgi:hypothetical protein